MYIECNSNMRSKVEYFTASENLDIGIMSELILLLLFVLIKESFSPENIMINDEQRVASFGYKERDGFRYEN